jgi:hypothetical protein
MLAGSLGLQQLRYRRLGLRSRSGSAIFELTDSPMRGEGRDVDQHGDIGWLPASAMTTPPQEWPTSTGRAVEAAENLPGGGDVAAEGEGGVLHDGYPVTVGNAFAAENADAAASSGRPRRSCARAVYW